MTPEKIDLSAPLPDDNGLFNELELGDHRLRITSLERRISVLERTVEDWLRTQAEVAADHQARLAVIEAAIPKPVKTVFGRRWVCSLCEEHFQTSAELLAHRGVHLCD